jgi:hypothetical protein
LKAYYVERNRLYLTIKTFSWPMLARTPFAALARYLWHVVSILGGRGKGAEFREAGHPAALLPLLVLRAHAVALVGLPRLLAERRRIRATRRLTPREFEALVAKHSIPVRQVAAL